MRSIRYPYAEIKYTKGVSFRPMLDAMLIAPNGESVGTVALADTGADFCLFPLNLAKMLRLDLAKAPTAVTRGVGNDRNLTYFETLTIDLGNGVIFTTVVGFTEGMNQAGFGLLGQQGFFENFNVEFRHRERIFTIATE